MLLLYHKFLLGTIATPGGIDIYKGSKDTSLGRTGRDAKA